MIDRHQYEPEDDTSRCAVCHQMREATVHLMGGDHEWPADLYASACEKCGLLYLEISTDDMGYFG